MRALEFITEACWKGYHKEGNKKMFGKTYPNCVKNESQDLDENQSGDSSLHDWFNKSKASDGTKGWVQIGGKYAGKPCAKQPGQTTKPKCGSSKMKRNLSAKDEEAAARRKRKEDPDPDRRGKAHNVATKSKRKTNENYIAELVNPPEDAVYFLVPYDKTIKHAVAGPFNTKHAAHSEYEFLCDTDPTGMASNHFKITDQFNHLIADLDPQQLADQPKWNIREDNNEVVAVIDGVRSDRKFNDSDHARNAMSKLISYGRAKHAEVYVNGKKLYNFELNKRHDDFEPKDLDESHGYHFGFQGEETPRALDAVNEYKLRPQVIEPEELVDVYVRGKHRGEFISRAVAKRVSNKMIPAIVKRLKDKYNIRPEAVVYGPSKEQIEEKWSNKYKRSIDCSHPKGFSQRAHCQGKKKK